ncbi:MAG TPA: DUF3011 domain-containing protein [Rhodanobacteraceae bacterium]
MRKIGWMFAAFAMVFAGAAMAQVRYSNQPPPPNYYPSRGYGNQTIACGSSQYRLGRCQTPGWRGARLVRQTSDAACVQGQTWGFDRGGIWVNNGCEGIFAPGDYYGGYGGGGGWRPGPGWNQNFVVGCGSPQYRYAFCQVDVGARGHVQLQQQTSNASCIEGQTWGWNRAGIWVDKGCGGQFMVVRRW